MNADRFFDKQYCLQAKRSLNSVAIGVTVHAGLQDAGIRLPFCAVSDRRHCHFKCDAQDIPTAVTQRYGVAALAFIVLPLVTAFFVYLINAFLIQFSLRL
ncbi:MAG TPA: hypothetical protein VIN05_14170 [Roseovarius sp.]